jgi:RNA polymerase sigma-70 factor, ECF subfamily
MDREGSLGHLISFSPEEAFQAKKRNYESLVFQHTPGLLRCAFRLTRSAAEAEDLVQDALLRAWQYWDGFEQGSNCRAWLYRILINVFRRSFDQPERKNRHLSTDHPELTNVLRFEHKFELDEYGVREAFSRIPREYQEVIELVLVEEFSYKEAAEILEVPMGTVMSRLFRGRHKMQSLLRTPTHREASSNG